MQQEFVRIMVLENLIEAQVVSSVLEDRNIPHQVVSYRDTAYDGLFQVQKGWGELRAPAAFETEIQAVVAEVRSGLWEEDNKDI